ncbi:MAG: hypothetical protein QXV05_02990 [Candidatus Korarchaeum sp.]
MTARAKLLVALAILALVILLISWNRPPSGRSKGDGIGGASEETTGKVEAIILKYRDANAVFDVIERPIVVKLGDKIYLFYSVRFKCPGCSLTFFRYEYIVVVLREDLTPLFRVKLNYIPWKVQKYNETRIIAMRGWTPVSAWPGEIIMYNEELRRAPGWFIERNFTDFEVINGTIYALEYRHGDYYLDEIDSRGRITRSAKVIGREEIGILMSYSYFYFSGESAEDWRSREYVGEYPVLLPNLEPLDDGLYMIWYGRLEGNSTTRTKIRISKVGFEGRSNTSEVEIGGYKLGWPGDVVAELSVTGSQTLAITRKDGEIVMLREYWVDPLVWKGECELIYLDREGNLLGKVNLSDRILPTILGGNRLDYGCFGSVHVGDGDVYVSAMFEIAAEIKVHSLTIANGTELRKIIRYMDTGETLIGGVFRDGSVLYIMGNYGRGVYVVKADPSLVGVAEILRKPELGGAKVIFIEDIPERVPEW